MNYIIGNDPAYENTGDVLRIIFSNPGFHALVLYRASHFIWERGYRFPAEILKYFNRILTGADIHPAARIGENFYPDHPTGVVIGETSNIGDNVTVYSGVVFGSRGIGYERNERRHPKVGNNVTIGTGAKIIGSIEIGNNVRIGANAVVNTNIPPNSVAVGIPAKVVKKLED